MNLGRALKEKRRDRRDVAVFILILVFGFLALLVLFVTGVIEELGLLLGLIALLIFAYLKSPSFIIEVKEYERAIVFRMGRYIGKPLGPGWHVLIPVIDEPIIVDMRTQTIDVPKQDVVTKDEIGLTIDAVIYIRVQNPEEAILSVRDYKRAAVSATYAHLRDIIGKMTLSEVLSNIEKVNEMVKRELVDVAKDWGVLVEKVEIQEVVIPEKVLSAMHQKKAAQELKEAARQEARATEIRIDAVREAAGKLNEPALEYLYLEALKKIADGRSSKIIFPVELSRMAERISGLTGKSHSEVEQELRRRFEEFVREREGGEEKREAQEGPSEDESKKDRERGEGRKRHIKHFLKSKPKPKQIRTTRKPK